MSTNYCGSCTTGVGVKGGKLCHCPTFVKPDLDDLDVEETTCGRCGHKDFMHTGPKRMTGVTWDPVKGFSAPEGVAEDFTAQDYYKIAEAALATNLEKNKARAEENYRKALQVDNMHPGSLVGYAELLAEQGRFRLAEDLVGKVLRMTDLADPIVKNRATRLAGTVITSGHGSPKDRWAKDKWKKAQGKASSVAKMASIGGLLARGAAGGTTGHRPGSGSRPGSSQRPLGSPSGRPLSSQSRLLNSRDGSSRAASPLLRAPSPKRSPSPAKASRGKSRPPTSCGMEMLTIPEDEEDEEVLEEEEEEGEGEDRDYVDTSLEGALQREEERNAKKQGPAEYKGCEGWMARHMFDATDELLQRWDIAGLVLVLYTAIAAPYEVAFLEPELGPLFVLNRFIDIFFLSDMVLQFFVKPIGGDGRIISRPSLIARNYLFGWFPVDVISVIPFDLLSVIADSSDMGNLKALRVIRVLRLIKLARVFRVSRLLVRWQNMFAVNYNLLSLVNYLVLVLTASHWFCCMYKLVESLETTSPNWVEADGNNLSKSNLETYIAGIHWSVQTISSIGYGDVGPQTTAERAWQCLGMFIGGVIFAFALGAISGAMTSLSIKEDQFHRVMEDTNSFMEDVQLPYNTRVAVRAYLKNRYNTNTLVSDEVVIAMLSPALREEVALHAHSDWVHTIPFFEGCPDRFVVSLAISMTLLALVPRERVFDYGDDAEHLYIIKRGVVGFKGAVLTKGKVFGTEALHNIIVTPVVRANTATTLTYVDLHALSAKTMQEVLKRFPLVYPRVFSLACKAILIQHVHAFVQACQSYATGRTGQCRNPLVKEMENELKSRKKRVTAASTVPYGGLVRAPYARELSAMKAELRKLGSMVASAEEEIQTQQSGGKKNPGQTENKKEWEQHLADPDPDGSKARQASVTTAHLDMIRAKTGAQMQQLTRGFSFNE